MKSKPNKLLTNLSRPYRAVVNYFRDSVKELSKVNWPTRSQAIRLTVGVFAFSLFLAGFISLIDLGLNSAFKHLILKQ